MLASSTTLKTSSTTVLASAAGATFIGATNASTAGGTSIALAVPTGAQVAHIGDLLIAAIGHRGGAGGNITAPAGWVPTAQISSTIVLAQRIFYKIAVLGDLGSTVTFNFGVSAQGAGVLLAFRGIDNSAPVFALTGFANPSAANIAIPALTMVTSDIMRLAIAGKAHDEAHSQVSGWTLNPAATVASGGGGATSRNRVSVQYQTYSGANPSSATVVATTAAVSIGHQVALLVGLPNVQIITALPGDYAYIQAFTAALVKTELFGASNAAYGVTGIAAQLVLGNVPPMTASPGAYGVTGTLATFIAGGLVYTTVGTVSGSASSYSDTTAVAATTYQYRIAAANAGEETLSNVDLVTTPAASNFPMTASPGAYSAVGAVVFLLVPIAFTASPATVALTGVAATLLNPFLSWDIIDTLGPSASSFSDIGLLPATTYIYRVVAINPSGQTLSNYDTATTLQGVVDYPLSAAVGAYAVTGKDATVLLVVRALPSTYAVTGVLANVVLSRTMPTVTGSYAFVGQDASPDVAGNVLAAKGTHAVTGVAASPLLFFVGQTAVPAGDISDGNWTPSTGTDLYATIDEVSDDVPTVDTDYITSLNPVNDEAVVDLTDLATPNPGTVQFVVRARRTPPPAP